MKSISNGILRGLALSLSLFAFNACTTAATPAEDSQTARVELIDHVSSALTTNTVMAVKGTYGAGCTSRTGAWTIALNGYVMVTGETPLTVVTNDTTCVLTLTDVKAGPVATPVDYKPATPLVLTAAYATAGIAFMTAGTGPVIFYANFRIQPDLLYATDMVIQMVYSDNVSETDLSSTTSYVVVVSTATASSVPAANATMVLTGLNIKVNAHNIVNSASGNIVVTQGSVVAEFYVIDMDTVGSPPTFATLDAAYNLTTNTRVPMVGATQNIAAADLNLLGLDLTTGKKRNVIVANIVNGVNSYQVFQITFNHP